MRLCFQGNDVLTTLSQTQMVQILLCHALYWLQSFQTPFYLQECTAGAGMTYLRADHQPLLPEQCEAMVQAHLQCIVLVRCHNKGKGRESRSRSASPVLAIEINWEADWKPSMFPIFSRAISTLFCKPIVTFQLRESYENFTSSLKQSFLDKVIRSSMELLWLPILPYSTLFSVAKEELI